MSGITQAHSYFRFSQVPFSNDTQIYVRNKSSMLAACTACAVTVPKLHDGQTARLSSTKTEEQLSSRGREGGREGGRKSSREERRKQEENVFALQNLSEYFL